MTTEPDLFAEFESIGEILAFVLHSEGPKALQQLLKIAALDQEALHLAADGLAAAEMMEGPELVAKAADQIEDQSTSEIARIIADPVRGNRRAYLAQAYRRGRIDMDDLEAAGVDNDTIDYINRSKAKTPKRLTTFASRN